MNDNQLIEKKIKLLAFIWVFFIAELVVLISLTYFILLPEQLNQSVASGDVIFLYFSYILSITAMPIVFKIYDIQKNKLKKGDSEKTKLEKYQIAVIIKFAILELAAVFSLIAFYLNEIKEPLYMFGIVFVAILLNKPSYKQFEKDFLKEADENVIEEIVYLPDETTESEINNEETDIK